MALELAAETEKMSAFQNVNEGEVEQDSGPKSPDDTVMSQTQMLSYYKPIESKCWRNASQSGVVTFNLAIEFDLVYLQ